MLNGVLQQAFFIDLGNEPHNSEKFTICVITGSNSCFFKVHVGIGSRAYDAPDVNESIFTIS